LPREAIIEELRRGASHRAISKKLGVPRRTLERHLALIPAHTYCYGPNITEAHGELLARSAVSPAVAAGRGYRSGPEGLVIPLWLAGGKRAWSQVRLDRPRNRRARYRNSRDALAVIDVSPNARPLVLDPERRLYVTESPRKADAATSAGLACVAVAGVRLLCLDTEAWEYIGVARRDVFIAFDVDAATNPEVYQAERRLAAFLHALGARVHITRLDGDKTGLDDFLARGFVEADLLARSGAYIPPGERDGAVIFAPPRQRGPWRLSRRQRKREWTPYEDVDDDEPDALTKINRTMREDFGLQRRNK
jgi:hypothetical protein